MLFSLCPEAFLGLLLRFQVRKLKKTMDRIGLTTDRDPSSPFSFLQLPSGRNGCSSGCGALFCPVCPLTPAWAFNFHTAHQLSSLCFFPHKPFPSWGWLTAVVRAELEGTAVLSSECVLSCGSILMPVLGVVENTSGTPVGYQLWRALFFLHNRQTQNKPLKPVAGTSILPTMYGRNGNNESDFQTVFSATHPYFFLPFFQSARVGSLQSSPVEGKNIIVRNLESEVVTSCKAALRTAK